VVGHDGKKLGIFTDLGHPFPALHDAMAEVDAAYLECNYDPEMLRRGPYPAALKRRIAGRSGHLSNDEAAELAGHGAAGGLNWLAAAHLSQHNNQPQIALATLRNRVGKMLPLHLAPRDRVGDLLEV
jgi:phosphoribosyl 1,2-cyclic phosphodiesterase